MPTSTLSRKLQKVLSEIETPLVIETQRGPGPKDLPYGIPVEEWPTVLARVENHESYRKIARDYDVSRETIRRLAQALKPYNEKNCPGRSGNLGHSVLLEGVVLEAKIREGKARSLPSASISLELAASRED